MTPAELAQLRLASFTVDSPCGRRWEVPLRSVFNDYVRYRRDNDHVTRAEVIRDTNASDIEIWFLEQYNWDDVERDGRLLRNPTDKQIRSALNLVRGGSAPSNAATFEAVSPHERARQARKALRLTAGATVPNTSSPAPKL